MIKYLTSFFALSVRKPDSRGRDPPQAVLESEVRMDKPIETTVRVQYANRDGWHIFTSPDVHGLYVASKNPRDAYDDVPLALQRIMELDFSCECEVTRPLTFEQFEAMCVNGGERSSLSPVLANEALHVKGLRRDLSAHAH